MAADEPLTISTPPPGAPTYADLAAIESTFESIDTATTAYLTHLLQPAHARRAAAVSKIQYFWPLVFEQAPQDVDQYIQPSDSAVFAKCLMGFNVERFECRGSAGDFERLARRAEAESEGRLGQVKGPRDELDTAPFGEPRSLCLRFEFAENEWFEDRVLEKKFWYRRSRDGWCGRVSEPVRINWKKGKDLSDGLVDAACNLWEAQEKAGFCKGEGGEEAKKEEEKSKSLPEYKKAVQKVENSTEGSQSFFTWFGFRGKWVSVAEDKIARQEFKERAKKAVEEQAKAGSTEGKEAEAEAENDDEEEEEDLMPSDAAAEVFIDGEELALALAEDLWANAISFFHDSQAENDDESMSSGSFDEAELEAMDVEELDEGDQNLEDIRQLPKKGTSYTARKNPDEPPRKKMKA